MTFPESVTAPWAPQASLTQQEERVLEGNHTSMGGGVIALDLEPVVGGCPRGSGRFRSIEAIEDSGHLLVLCTLRCVEPEKVSPKSERWRVVITQSSTVLPCNTVRHFNLHFI